MAVKSVIEIDVLDEKFKAFQAAFEKYKKSVEDQTKQWKEINKQIAEAEKRQKDLNKAFKDGFSALQGAAGLAAGIATSMASAAVSAAKWLALGAVGGGFGLGGLASSASDYRRQAQGLGVTTGQIRSANVTFGRYINPDQTLSNIANVQSDLSRRQILGRLGGKEGQNAAEMLPAIIQNAVNQFNAGEKTQQYAETMGLTQIFSMDELRRLSSLSKEELKDAVTQYVELQEKLKVTDADSKAWQKFLVQLQISGHTIETAFIKNLVALEPKLETLTQNITKVGELLITKLGNWLASPEFEEDVKKFIDGLEALGNAVIKMAKFFGLISETKKEKIDRENAKYNALPSKQRAAQDQMAALFGNYSQRRGGRTLSEINNNPGDLRYAGQAGAERGYGGFAKFSSPEAGLRAMAVQLQLYQNRDRLDTLQGIISKYTPRSENDTAAYIAAVSKSTGYKAGEHLNLNDADTLAKVMSAMTKQENARSNYTPQTVKSIIQMDTGGQTVLNTVPMQ